LEFIPVNFVRVPLLGETAVGLPNLLRVKIAGVVKVQHLIRVPFRGEALILLDDVCGQVSPVRQQADQKCLEHQAFNRGFLPSALHAGGHEDSNPPVAREDDLESEQKIQEG
jgi:hypothetical protein